MKQVIETRHLRDARQMALSIRDSLDTGPIGQIVGEPGTGKTWAGKWLAQKLDGVRVCCSHGITSRALALKISVALDEPNLSGSTSALVARLEKRASGRLLIVDEANQLRWQ
ncbi:ATP-binding protein [Salmonella enterica]|nr:ATP-binding protein [Salmonella enterica]